MKIKSKDKIEVFCKYCERATPLALEGKLVCAKKGVVSEDFKCRRFVYDPLKRAPKILTVDASELDMPSLED